DVESGGGNDELDINSAASVLFNSTQQLGGLKILGGTVTLAANGNRTLYLNTLSINSAGRLDLADNDLVVNNGSFTDIRNLVFQGYGSTTGVTSTPTGNTILALLDNTLLGTSTWNGQTISPSAIVGKHTYFGDMDFDGQVTA